MVNQSGRVEHEGSIFFLTGPVLLAIFVVEKKKVGWPEKYQMTQDIVKML